MGLMEKERRRVFLQTINAYLLQPYDWGGQGLGGVDCSGLVVEGLRACGIFTNKQDTNAHGIWTEYRDRYSVGRPSNGCIVFWFNQAGKAIHTAVGIGPYHCIGAHGGNSTTTDSDKADAQEAFVKIRTVNYRSEQFKCIDLFK